MEDKKGYLHILTHTNRELIKIFEGMAFEFAEGPEIESEYNNFDALNVAKNHPARDMHDTFWLKNRPGELLRTHISALQVPYMKGHTPPLGMISSGRVFRFEATDATHEAQFTYLEGLAVGKDLTMANLKGVLLKFLQTLYGEETKIRMRPSYFPFVEPGVEVDLSCFKCKGKGCSLCKETGWIEVMGAGMVHPKVLQNGGINPRDWQGFAFGMGTDRLAILKHGINDIRLFYSGDLRLVRQFKDESKS